jgi:aryl-alcohol dehydrogenase-like predicted oxidoreductase
MLSKIILGTAQIGMNYGINNSRGKISVDAALDILNFASINGIEYLDTAPVYGDAQKIIGEFHRQYTGEKFKVISKIPAGFPIERIEQFVDGLLFEMNVNVIDTLHFHSITDYIYADFNEMTKIFSHLKHNEKVKSFGLSIYENTDVDKINRSLIDVIQLPFNLLDNLNLRGRLLGDFKKENFEIHSRSAFLQGLFFTDSNNINSAELKKSLEALREICSLYNMTMEEIALNYCVYQEFIDKVLIGVDGLDQLKRNIEIINEMSDLSYFKLINEINFSDTSVLNPSKWNVKLF